MAERLGILVFVLIYCVAFPLPAGAVRDGWVRLLGTAAVDWGFGVAADSTGNVYVTGYTEGNLGGETNAGGSDIFLAKYNGSGATEWVRLLGTTSGESARGLASDSTGNVYVTGYTEGNLSGETNAGRYDIFLAKYDGSGTRQWVRLLGTESWDEGHSVAADSTGNVYVTGYTEGNLSGETNAGGFDIFLAKYNGQGDRQWVRLLGTEIYDFARGVALDSTGNVYVAGYTAGNLEGETNAGYEDVFLAKYNGSGVRQWVRLLGTAYIDIGHGAAADASGNVYVTGYTGGNLGGETNAGGYDIFLAKYNGRGDRQWVRLLGTASSDPTLTDDGRGVAADAAGNAYVAGYTGGNLSGETNAGASDIFLAKYNGSGVRQWVRLLGTASWDEGHSVASDSTGNVYVTGYTEGNLDGKANAGSLDIFLWKHSESFPWELFYPAILKKRQ